MDPMTAGVAAVTVQLCAALMLAGSYYLAPAERFTQFAALSSVFIAVGLAITIFNAGAPRYALLIIGNSALVGGLLLQWRVLCALHRSASGRPSLILFVLFSLVYSVLTLSGGTFAERTLVCTSMITLILTLNACEVWFNRGKHWTFPRILALVALALLISSFGFRALTSLMQNPESLVTTSSSTGVLIVYMLPLIGTLLFSTALLLLYLERVIAEKNHLATHDELTRLLNRRAIIARGEREIEVAARQRQPIAAAFVDVDFFKKINDELGHERGDSVLYEIGQVLSQASRNVDLIGRYGGEEFCLIFPNVGGDGAVVVAERLLKAVRQHRFAHGRPLTVSIGMAVLSPDDIDRSWVSLIHRADVELYKAKTSGRDRFGVSTAVSLPGRSTADRLDPRYATSPEQREQRDTHLVPGRVEYQNKGTPTLFRGVQNNEQRTEQLRTMGHPSCSDTHLVPRTKGHPSCSEQRAKQRCENKGRTKEKNKGTPTLFSTNRGRPVRRHSCCHPA
jgi:diguanylate cyclase (GGDEF)-like protein